MTTDDHAPTRLLWAAGVLVCAAVAATLVSVTSPLGLLFGLTAQLIFVLPGYFIVRQVAGEPVSPKLELERRRGWLAPVAFGPLVGQALGSLALTGLWAAGGRGLWTIGGSAAIVAFLIIPARRLAGRWRLPVTLRGDTGALLLLLLIVPVIVGVPFSKVGEPVPDGKAYRAYFTADYVWRRAVVAEIAKGEFPPRNPYFLDDSMHYYWMPHMLSGVEYRAAGNRIDLDQLLLMRSVFIDVFFVAMLYGFARVFVKTPWAAALGVAAVTFCSSFEGLCAILVYNRDGVPLSQLRNLNVDAVSRWFYQGMPIDGLQRLFLYQPHHQVGYATGLLALVAVARRARPSDRAVFAAAGVLLGLSTLISSFAGLMFTVAAALSEACSVVRHREWGRGIAHAVAAGVPLAIAAGLVLALQYVDTSGSVLRVGLNPVSTHSFIWVTFLSLGPVLIVGAAGGYYACRERRGELWLLASLAATCLVFYFLIDVRDHQNVYVGWRVGHLLFMTFPVLFAIGFERLAGLRDTRRIVGVALVSMVLIAGMPTSVIDLYNTQDIENRNEAPGFRWTMVQSPEDLQLFAWLKANTTADSIVQVDPKARDSATWAYLPAFAERRMSVGLPISMVPLAKYEQGSQRLSDLYNASAPEAYATLVRNHVEYVIVGPPERQWHPDAEQKFDSIPTLMPLVLRNATISVYKVIPEI